jgi:hypothetical protein
MKCAKCGKNEGRPVCFQRAGQQEVEVVRCESCLRAGLDVFAPKVSEEIVTYFNLFMNGKA